VTVLSAVILTVLVMVVLTILVNNFIPTERKIKHQLPHHYGISDPQFVRAIGQLLGPPVLEGNTVDLLENGVRIFPAMLEAIPRATKTVTLESYIWTEGQVTDQVSTALAACAQRGVKVHVLLDAAGCGLTHGPTMIRMRDAGVEVEVYHLSNVARFNFRTHRKLLVIDGMVGFIGGAGFADEWLGDAHSPRHWRDTHFRVTGPVVAQLQAAFNDNWMKARARVLDGKDYFPALQPTGNVRCQTFKSSPQEGSESARLMFLLSLAAAEHSIHIGNAYFVPDDLTVETLLQARQRGVTINIIIPGGHQDSKMVRRACRERSGRLLAAGVRFYEYQPTMYHCKCLIIDGLWCSVGSSNFDNRSFRLNDEANLNILDLEVASLLTKQFVRDRSAAREVTYEQWQNRRWVRKIADKCCALLRSQI
jgi:cardiolipin synthase